MNKLIFILGKYQWLWLIVVAPALVLPSPKRSLALLVIPALWILNLRVYFQENVDQPSTINLQPSTMNFQQPRKDSGFPVTPLNSSLLVLSVMVMFSLWATYDISLSLEKISGMVLGLGVFFAVVRESRNLVGWWLSLAVFLGGGLAWALLGFLGMNYQVRFSFLAPVISRIPVIIKDLPGAESGLQHNAVGGTLLWVFPLLLVFGWFTIPDKNRRLETLLEGLAKEDRPLRRKNLDRTKAADLSVLHRLSQGVYGWLQRVLRSTIGVCLVRIGLWGSTLFVSAVLLLTQSRGSYLAFGVILLGILLLSLPTRWRWVLLGLVGIAGVGLLLLLVQAGGWKVWISQLGLSSQSGLSIDTLGTRLEIWSRAIYGIQDFPITGMGMNTFREVVHALYPLFTISPDFDIAHAHNEFLQAALDLGIPGLIAFISIYGISFWMLLKTWQVSTITLGEGSGFLQFQDPIMIKTLVLGLGGGLFGHMVFGMTDAITLGAKPGIFYWMLLGLITGLYNNIKN